MSHSTSRRVRLPRRRPGGLSDLGVPCVHSSPPLASGEQEDTCYGIFNSPPVALTGLTIWREDPDFVRVPVDHKHVQRHRVSSLHCDRRRGQEVACDFPPLRSTFVRLPRGIEAIPLGKVRGVDRGRRELAGCRRSLDLDGVDEDRVGGRRLFLPPHGPPPESRASQGAAFPGAGASVKSESRRFTVVAPGWASPHLVQ